MVPLPVLGTNLFDFLLQLSKNFSIEKIRNRNAEAIAELFDRRHCSTVISAADDVVDCGLSNTAHRTKLI